MTADLCPECGELVRIIDYGKVRVWQDHGHFFNRCKMSGVMVP